MRWKFVGWERGQASDVVVGLRWPGRTTCTIDWKLLQLTGVASRPREPNGVSRDTLIDMQALNTILHPCVKSEVVLILVQVSHMILWERWPTFNAVSCVPSLFVCVYTESGISVGAPSLTLWGELIQKLMEWLKKMSTEFRKHPCAFWFLKHKCPGK